MKRKRKKKKSKSNGVIERERVIDSNEDDPCGSCGKLGTTFCGGDDENHLCWQSGKYVEYH